MIENVCCVFSMSSWIEMRAMRLRGWLNWNECDEIEGRIKLRGGYDIALALLLRKAKDGSE